MNTIYVIHNNVSNNIFTTDTKEEKIEEEHTPKLFSEDQNQHESHDRESKEHKEEEQLFNQDTNEEEDFEIPAFLRRQKF